MYAPCGSTVGLSIIWTRVRVSDTSMYPTWVYSFFLRSSVCGRFLDNHISISMSKHKYLKKNEELKHHRLDQLL